MRLTDNGGRDAAPVLCSPSRYWCFEPASSPSQWPYLTWLLIFCLSSVERMRLGEGKPKGKKFTKIFHVLQPPTQKLGCSWIFRSWNRRFVCNGGEGCPIKYLQVELSDFFKKAFENRQTPKSQCEKLHANCKMIKILQGKGV